MVANLRWRNATIIGMHLAEAVAIAVQRCTGKALQKSQWREREVAMVTIRRRKWRQRSVRVVWLVCWCCRLAAQCSAVEIENREMRPVPHVRSCHVSSRAYGESA